MQTRSEETRNRILETSARLFSQVGYEATGVAEICSMAGISKGAFYHHFPSKHAVFMQLLEDWLSHLERNLEAARRNADSIPEAFLDMSTKLDGVFQEANQRLPIFLEFWTQASRDQAVWQATIAPYRRFQVFIADLIREGITEGSFQPVDPDQTARAVIAVALGLLLQSLLDPQGADWRQLIRSSIQKFLDGIQRRSS